MRIARIPALLVGTVIAAPLSAQVPNVHAAARAPGNGTTVVVWPRDVQSLQARLDSFAVALPPAERALWDGVLLRAAHAPTPAAAEVRVRPVLQIGPGGGCDATPGMDEAANRVAIVVQGGRTAGSSGIVVQGGRTPAQREGIVVQGGRTPAQPEGIVVQGGRTPAQPEGIVVQGGRTPAQPEGIVVQGGRTPASLRASWCRVAARRPSLKASWCRAGARRRRASATASPTSRCGFRRRSTAR